MSVIYTFMRVNLLEGFGDWVRQLDNDPKHGVNQNIILSNITLTPSDGSEPIKYGYLAMFKVLNFDPNTKTATIQDVSDNAAGFNKTAGTGKKFVLTGEEFDKLLMPQIKKQEM